MLRPWKLELKIDYQSKKAIYIQIADAIITEIRSGRLLAGTALPGSRLLAAELKVNRNTIVDALQVLQNEQWLVSKERQGTFVADVLPAVLPEKANVTNTIETVTKVTTVDIDFDDGHPNSKIAPITELARAYRQIFQRKGKWQMMGYTSAQGDPGFRTAIVQMLNHQRGMSIKLEQLAITRGSQMAMYLAAHALFESGSYVIVENPGYQPAWEAFQNAGAKLLTANVDEEGMSIQDIHEHISSRKNISAIYVTPHRQYPTTVSLSRRRRQDLIKLSNQHNITIIEDDYDNEFHFGYRPLLPLCSEQELRNYVYIGTLSKVVAPSLRIGFVISNSSVIMKKMEQHRKVIDVQGDTIMEQAVLQLINDGTIKRHIRKATQYYKDKRDYTEKLLDDKLSTLATYSIPEGGLAFWIVPKKSINWDSLCNRMQLIGVSIINPAKYYFDESPSGLRLGYGSLTKEQLNNGISALAKLLADSEL